MQIGSRKRSWLIAVILLGGVMLIFAGCGGPSPALGQAGRPTLVFVYTDG